MAIDASFKAANKMRQYDGASVYDLIFTIKSDYDEIRQQFYAVTELHDQLSKPLRELRNTQESYGQAGPDLAYPDNPRRDEDLLLNTFPSLAKRQAALDKLSEEMNKMLEKMDKLAAAANTTAARW
jgi:uncharacterized coiled-coil DUF342 family protein